MPPPAGAAELADGNLGGPFGKKRDGSQAPAIQRLLIVDAHAEVLACSSNALNLPRWISQSLLCVKGTSNCLFGSVRNAKIFIKRSDVALIEMKLSFPNIAPVLAF